jgi:predicted nucleotidyltransferase
VTADNLLLRQMVDIVVQTADPESIILFGSQARGDASESSDLDLLVIDRQAFSATHRRQDEVTKLYLALRKFPISTDVLLYSHDEFEHWKHSLNHVIGRAFREGKVLHVGH